MFSPARFCLLALAVLLAASPAQAGKKKDPAPPPAAPAAPAAPTIDPAFEADIRKLLIATGAGTMGIQMMDQMLVSLKPMAPGLPDAFWEGVKSEFKSDDLINLVVPIYARHLSHDDVRALIAFYESPAGRKMIEVQPAIMAESMQVGQVWGQEIAMRVVARMEAEQKR
ncbi:MAG: DUF2059 domain-containing protein [Pseudomonadota bacterium]|nr:DUF2059 domain-containing protein [Pseudomonadota bacterium]